jgi:hypothetical protein
MMMVVIVLDAYISDYLIFYLFIYWKWRGNINPGLVSVVKMQSITT